MASFPKVDVHHHVIPPEIADFGYGMKNIELPTWNLTDDKNFSKSIGVRTRIFSVSTPGVLHVSDPEDSAKMARSMNIFCANLRNEDPHSAGFFATIPSLEHAEHALRELRYAFDVLHADGVTLFTRYGTAEKDGYLGHPDYVYLWEELNRREAVVFVHPTSGLHAPPSNELILGPAFDWPHETGRTAMDLILHRRLHQFTSVKIILSHAGGTLPLLIRRATMISLPEMGSVMEKEDVMDQAKRFYFDLALAGSKEVLPMILGFAGRGHVLFGSDYPHATVGFAKESTEYVDRYDMEDGMRKEIYHGAAEKLFPILKGLYS